MPTYNGSVLPVNLPPHNFRLVGWLVINDWESLRATLEKLEREGFLGEVQTIVSRDFCGSSHDQIVTIRFHF
jgi:hypothetical protein